MGLRMRFKIAIILMCYVAMCEAQELVIGQSSKEPIDITSNELIFYRKENIAVFTGNVIAVQGNTSVKADKMEVFFRASTERAEEKLSKVKSINLKNNVEIITPQEKATATDGVYNAETGVFTLTDNVTLTQGETVLKGNKMVYDKNTEESLLTSGNKRASARFVPNQTGKDE